MNSNTTNLRDIKKMRLERHWSQEQLAEMSGLSIRTIQRIENGENAGLESLKSLAAVFDTNIADSDKKEEEEQIRKEEEYVQNVKGFYKLARSGKIKNYTGIDSPYEVPENPDLIIDTDNQSIEESVSTILNFIELNGIII